MRPSTTQIPPALNAIVDHLAAMPDVDRVILYGSRARGDHDPRSDIDLAIMCRSSTTKQRWAAIEAYLEDEAPTLLRIDVIRFDEASERMQAQIQHDGVTLYGR